MTILFIAPLPDPVTGQSLACQVLLDEVKNTHAVDIVNMSKRRQHGIASFLLRIGEVFMFVWQAWRKQRFASVIYFNISESLSGLVKDWLIYLVCLGKLPKMVVHLHGGAGMREIMRAENSILRSLNAFFLKRVGGIIVLGPSQVNIFDNLAPKDRIHVVPNFAQDEMFVTEDEIHAKFSLYSPVRLLFLSNLLPGKGYRELVAAINALSDELRGRLVVDFAGGFQSNQDRSDFMAMISAIPQIHYHGVVQGKTKIDLLSTSHIFCLPTYYPYEGQPISILEAYASGCAVITTDHSGIPDIFTPGINGYRVDKRSIESLRAVIELALDEPGRVLQMALGNHTAAVQQYRTERFNRQIIQIIESME